LALTDSECNPHRWRQRSGINESKRTADAGGPESKLDSSTARQRRHRLKRMRLDERLRVDEPVGKSREA